MHDDIGQQGGRYRNKTIIRKWDIWIAQQEKISET